MKCGAWFRLTRPFTLLPPAVGMVTGSLAAIGAGAVAPEQAVFGPVLLGALMAMTLNVASNVWNQIHDLELDRVNRPERPLVSGEIGLPAARRFAFATYGLALLLAALLQPTGHPELLYIVLFTAFLTWAYSAPPLRARRSWWAGPLVIAVPRGGLLKVAGWAAVAGVVGHPEPWLLGAVFFLFILGAAPTKDFADTRGDAAAGCESLPLRFGFRGAALRMAPFYVLPWLLFLALSLLPVPPAWALEVAGGPALLVGCLLLLHGSATAIWLVRRGERLGERRRGRAAWVNLYVLMMEAQIGVAWAYLVS